MSAEVRRWRLHLKTGHDLAGLAAWINPIVAGWMNYYGRFYRSRLYPLLQRINTYLMRWAGKKYKRLRSFRRFHACWLGIVRHDPALFAHWRWVRRSRSPNCDEKSGVTGDCHAPFRGSPGVQGPGPPDCARLRCSAAPGSRADAGGAAAARLAAAAPKRGQRASQQRLLGRTVRHQHSNLYLLSATDRAQHKRNRR